MEGKLPAKSFKDLVVWQHAHQFVIEVYKMTQQLPKEELYGITSQIRRYAVSVSANIAEGFKKKSNADKIRILNIAQGSLSESQYFLLLIKDLDYSNTDMLNNKSEDVAKLVQAYMNSLKNKPY